MKQQPQLSNKRLRAQQWLGATLASKGHWWVVLRGNSMAPDLPAGSRVRISSGAVPVPGDLGVYRCDRGLIVHRLVQVRTDFHTGRRIYLFQGDACRRTDPPVKASDLIGVVTATRGPSWLWRVRTSIYRRLKAYRAARSMNHRLPSCERATT